MESKQNVADKPKHTKNTRTSSLMDVSGKTKNAFDLINCKKMIRSYDDKLQKVKTEISIWKIDTKTRMGIRSNKSIEVSQATALLDIFKIGSTPKLEDTIGTLKIVDYSKMQYMINTIIPLIMSYCDEFNEKSTLLNSYDINDISIEQIQDLTSECDEVRKKSQNGDFDKISKFLSSIEETSTISTPNPHVDIPQVQNTHSIKIPDPPLAEFGQIKNISEKPSRLKKNPIIDELFAKKPQKANSSYVNKRDKEPVTTYQPKNLSVEEQKNVESLRLRQPSTTQSSNINPIKETITNTDLRDIEDISRSLGAADRLKSKGVVVQPNVVNKDDVLKSKQEAANSKIEFQLGQSKGAKSASDAAKIANEKANALKIAKSEKKTNLTEQDILLLEKAAKEELARAIENSKIQAKLNEVKSQEKFAKSNVGIAKAHTNMVQSNVQETVQIDKEAKIKENEDRRKREKEAADAKQLLDDAREAELTRLKDIADDTEFQRKELVETNRIIKEQERINELNKVETVQIDKEAKIKENEDRRKREKEAELTRLKDIAAETTFQREKLAEENKIIKEQEKINKLNQVEDVPMEDDEIREKRRMLEASKKNEAIAKIDADLAISTAKIDKEMARIPKPVVIEDVQMDDPLKLLEIENAKLKEEEKRTALEKTEAEMRERILKNKKATEKIQSRINEANQAEKILSSDKTIGSSKPETTNDSMEIIPPLPESPEPQSPTSKTTTTSKQKKGNSEEVIELRQQVKDAEEELERSKLTGKLNTVNSKISKLNKGESNPKTPLKNEPSGKKNPEYRHPDAEEEKSEIPEIKNRENISLEECQKEFEDLSNKYNRIVVLATLLMQYEEELNHYGEARRLMQTIHYMLTNHPPLETPIDRKSCKNDYILLKDGFIYLIWACIMYCYYAKKYSETFNIYWNHDKETYIRMYMWDLFGEELDDDEIEQLIQNAVNINDPYYESLGDRLGTQNPTFDAIKKELESYLPNNSSFNVGIDDELKKNLEKLDLECNEIKKENAKLKKIISIIQSIHPSNCEEVEMDHEKPIEDFLRQLTPLLDSMIGRIEDANSMETAICDLQKQYDQLQKKHDDATFKYRSEQDLLAKRISELPKPLRITDDFVCVRPSNWSEKDRNNITGKTLYCWAGGYLPQKIQDSFERNKEVQVICCELHKPELEKITQIRPTRIITSFATPEIVRISRIITDYEHMRGDTYRPTYSFMFVNGM